MSVPQPPTARKHILRLCGSAACNPWRKDGAAAPRRIAVPHYRGASGRLPANLRLHPYRGAAAAGCAASRP